MRMLLSLSQLVLCLLFIESCVVEARHAVVPRQDSPPAANSEVPASRSQPSANVPLEDDQPQATSIEASPSGFKVDSTGSEALQTASPSRAASRPSAEASAASSTDSSIIVASPVANHSSLVPPNASNVEADELPITPTITPALAVAGAILMLTGLFYTLIGIKTKWLHIFFSTAYLTSLAVTVLIVYVMHPPVSNAVQGAYFVAACVTGLIFGGGSVIFADVTEGLGCLLGGFSLAMWFLVLVPGGLIKSTAGKTIFIACFTLGSFAFYLSHWTRAYGMIGTTAFAGATVIVIGIDCFSRAGLKEFWLYVWGLNDDVFPLNYSGPYPITRGIRVEIAAIVIIFLIGVMSQMKIWKIIKKQREQRAAERLEREKQQDEVEQDLGRRIEEGNVHDRDMWEATYGRSGGNNRHIDSGIGTEAPSVSKGSLSIVGTSEVPASRGSIELDDLGNTKNPTSSDGKGKARATVTVRVASDDDVVQAAWVPTSSANGSGSATPHSDIHAYHDGRLLASGKARDSQSAKARSSPGVVPLPFNVPAEGQDEDDRSSIAASVASDGFSARMLKRLSGASLKRTSSKRSQRSYLVTSTSEEALVAPCEDRDGRPSSVAANVDEVSDGQSSEADATTLAALPSPAAEKLLKFSPPTEAHPVERPGHKISDLSLGQGSSREVDKGNEAVSDEAAMETIPLNPSKEISHEEANEDVPSPIPTDISSARPQVTEKPSLHDHLAGLGRTPKIAMTYRTNEWAKHLGDAQKPAADDPRILGQMEPDYAEKPAPLDISSLQQTPLTAEPEAALPLLPKLDTNTKPPRNTRTASTKSQDSLPASPYQSGKASRSFERTPSQTSLDSLPSQRVNPRNSQRPSQPPQRSTYRSSSTPLVHSPIEEDVAFTAFPQRPNLPNLPTTNTLMSHRQSMLSARPSSTSLAYTPSAQPPRRASNNSLRSGGGDDIPLSHHRNNLRHSGLPRNPSSSSNISASSNAYPYPSPSLSNNNSNNAISQWRTSLSSLPSQHAHLHQDSRHEDLLKRKRRSEMGVRAEREERAQRERGVDEMWRRSGAGMEERHREAMRKMQAKVGE
ncbi:MAG: hypothetical protein Q9174_003105 [Haloplaca sp. 1 TL-2023]